MTNKQFLDLYLAHTGFQVSGSQQAIQTQHFAKWKTNNGYSFVLAPQIGNATNSPTIVAHIEEREYLSVTHRADQVYGKTYFGQRAFVVSKGGYDHGFELPEDALRVISVNSVTYAGTGWSVIIKPQWNATVIETTGDFTVTELGSSTYEDSVRKMTGPMVGYGFIEDVVEIEDTPNAVLYFEQDINEDLILSLTPPIDGDSNFEALTPSGTPVLLSTFQTNLPPLPSIPAGTWAFNMWVQGVGGFGGMNASFSYKVYEVVNATPSLLFTVNTEETYFSDGPVYVVTNHEISSDIELDPNVEALQVEVYFIHSDGTTRRGIFYVGVDDGGGYIYSTIDTTLTIRDENIIPGFPVFSGSNTLRIWNGDNFGECPLEVFQTPVAQPDTQVYSPEPLVVSSDKRTFLQWENIFGPGPGQIPQGATIKAASLLVEASGTGSLTLKKLHDRLNTPIGIQDIYPGVTVGPTEGMWYTSYNYLYQSEIIGSGEFVRIAHPSERVKLLSSTVAPENYISRIFQPSNLGLWSRYVESASGNYLDLEDWIYDTSASGEYIVSRYGLFPFSSELAETIETVQVADGSGELPIIGTDVYSFDISSVLQEAQSHFHGVALELESDASITVQGVVDGLFQQNVPLSIVVVYDLWSLTPDASGEPTDPVDPSSHEEQSIDISAQLIDTRGQPIEGHPVKAWVSTNIHPSTDIQSSDLVGVLYDPTTGVEGSYVSPITGPDGVVRLSYYPPDEGFVFESMDMNTILFEGYVGSGEYDFAMEPQPNVCLSVSGEYVELKPIYVEDILQLEDEVVQGFKSIQLSGYPKSKLTISGGDSADGPFVSYVQYHTNKTPNSNLFPDQVPDNVFIINYEQKRCFINGSAKFIKAEYETYPFYVNSNQKKMLLVYPEPHLFQLSVAGPINIHPDIVLYLHLEYKDTLTNQVFRRRADIVLLNPYHKIQQALKNPSKIQETL